MVETQISESERYGEMFDVARQDANVGVEDVDYSDALNRLRERGPVLKGSPRALLGLPPTDPGHSIGPLREEYTLLSYRACERGFRENLVFSSAIMKESRGVASIGHTILEMVGDEHKRYRAVGQPLFLRPRVIDSWKPRWIDETVDALLNPLRGQDAADLNLALCARLPMDVITRAILGADTTDALHFRTHLVNSTFGQGQVSAEQAALSRTEVDRIMSELIADRLANGGDDVITGLLENDLKREDGSTRKLTNAEIFSYCKLIIFAGGGTTWRQLGITIDALLSHYHFWEQCRENRRLIEPAIEEALRWRPTDPIFPRLATEAVEVDGVTIPAGTRVQICLGAANRDPAIWDNPDAFDIHRPRKAHLGQGLGAHRCLGADVSKQEMVSAINGLMDRWPNLRLDPDQPAPRFIGLDHRGMSAVPVRLK